MEFGSRMLEQEQKQLSQRLTLAAESERVVSLGLALKRLGRSKKT